jgi:hypothetical protein
MRLPLLHEDSILVEVAMGVYMSRQSWISIAALLAVWSCRSRLQAPPAAIPLTAPHAPSEWRGLSEIYRETLVSRSPEVMPFEVSLPANPWLELSLGTVTDAPVTFRVRVLVRPSSQFGEPPTALLLERTLTRRDRWEPAEVDLSAFAGQKVTLTLGIDASSPGAIGLWGGPVVRDRGRPMPPGAPRGVLLISASGLRRDHLGAYGYARPTSPQIDRLAAEGTRFDAREASEALASSVETLAEAFRAAGYATVSFESSPRAGRPTSAPRGFGEVHASGSLPKPRTSKTAREYVDRLVPWLTAHKDTPFFAFLEVTDPEPPLQPYPPFDTLFDDGATADEGQRQIGWYDGSILAMDGEIGRVMEHLRALRLDRETLVAFTGEDLDEPGDAPLILHRPGSIAAGVHASDAAGLVPLLQSGAKLVASGSSRGADSSDTSRP